MRKVYEAQWVADKFQNVLHLLEMSADSVTYWGGADDFRRLHSACQNINTIRDRFARKAAQHDAMKQHDQGIQQRSERAKKSCEKTETPSHRQSKKGQ